MLSPQLPARPWLPFSGALRPWGHVLPETRAALQGVGGTHPPQPLVQPWGAVPPGAPVHLSPTHHPGTG